MMLVIKLNLFLAVRKDQQAQFTAFSTDSQQVFSYSSVSSVSMAKKCFILTISSYEYLVYASIWKVECHKSETILCIELVNFVGVDF